MKQILFTLLLLPGIIFGATQRVLTADIIEGQATEKNYIKNAEGEPPLKLKGYATYSDTSGVVPVDGTGGSPTLTLTQTSSTTAMDGTNYFLLTKDAANRQGNGASYDFTVPPSAQTKLVTITFDFIIPSGTFAPGTDSTTGDVNMFVYDKTNSALIYPVVGQKITGAVIGQKYTHTMQIQVPYNSTSLRLIWHVASTSASAWTFGFKHVQATRKSLSAASLTTDPQAYTPTFGAAWGTVTSPHLVWWQEGKFLKISGSFVTGTTTTGASTFTLPTGLVIDTTNLAGTLMNSFGRAWRIISGGTNGDLTVGTGSVDLAVVYNGTTNTVQFSRTVASGAYSSENTSTVFNSNELVNIELLTIPIKGWGTNTVSSSQDDGRDVVLLLNGTADISAANNANYIWPSAAVSYDSHGAYNSTTGTFTAPRNGLCEVLASDIYIADTGSGETGYFLLYKNGSFYSRMTVTPNGGSGVGTTGSALALRLNSGDTLTFPNKSSNNTTNRLVYSSGNQSPKISIICKSAGTIVSIPPVAAIYRGQVAASLTAFVTPLQFNTLVVDTHGSVTTGSGWKFTVRETGNYKITVNGMSTSSGTGTLVLYKNGTELYTNNYDKAICPINGTYLNSGTIEAPFVAGDYFDVRSLDAVTTQSGGSISINRMP